MSSKRVIPPAPITPAERSAFTDGARLMALAGDMETVAAGLATIAAAFRELAGAAPTEPRA